MTNKIVCRIKQPILYLTFLSSEFIDTVLALFVDAIFVIFPGKVIVTFVDSLSITFIICHTEFLKYQQYFSNTFHPRKYMCYSSSIIFFACIMFFTLALTFIIILILIWIASCTMHLQPHEICFTNVLVWCILVIILKRFTFTSFVLLGTHSFVDKSSAVLQLHVHLFRLIING